MANSPDFSKIYKESGPHTAEAISSLWALLNQLSIDERNHYRIVRDMIQPRVLTLDPSASVDNQNLSGCSIVSFIGDDAVNLTGFVAPETGMSRVVIIQVSGSGTITAKHEVTSEAANQLSCASGADVTLATGSGIIFAYLAGKWREVA